MKYFISEAINGLILEDYDLNHTKSQRIFSTWEDLVEFLIKNKPPEEEKK